MKETVDRFLEVAIDNKRSLKHFYENIDFAPELVGALMMAASIFQLPFLRTYAKSFRAPWNRIMTVSPRLVLRRETCSERSFKDLTL